MTFIGKKKKKHRYYKKYDIIENIYIYIQEKDDYEVDIYNFFFSFVIYLAEGKSVLL